MIQIKLGAIPIAQPQLIQNPRKRTVFEHLNNTSSVIKSFSKKPNNKTAYMRVDFPEPHSDPMGRR